MKTDAFDIAVIGSGFAGSLIAMIAKRLGHSVILIEKGVHPRFAIGESSTPLANLLLEELAQRYDLPRLLPLTKWGTWRESYPHLSCGLKRGFSFYHHHWDRPFTKTEDRSNELMVAASPVNRVADTHWYRQDFDDFLHREAMTLGVVYLDRTTIRTIDITQAEKVLELERHVDSRRVNARLIIDASGPRGVLHQLLGLEEVLFPNMPRTQALFSHFTEIGRLDSIPEFGNSSEAPFPVDDAAVHHLFPGGWIWVLRFNNGITSAGVAAFDSVANEFGFADGFPAWDRLLTRLPSLEKLFHAAQVQRPFVHVARLPFRTSRTAGPGWVLLPSAAGFVDPLLSTGFPLTLLGISRIAQILETRPAQYSESIFDDYEAMTFSDLDAAATLVGALYATMDDFELFSKLSLLYFAAVSYSETSRRLNKSSSNGKFLLGDNRLFAEQMRICCAKAVARNPADRTQLLADINSAILPIDIAGLTNQDRRNWFPVDSADLIQGAGKLKATEQEIRQLLNRCGFDDKPNAP